MNSNKKTFLKMGLVNNACPFTSTTVCVHPPQSPIGEICDPLSDNINGPKMFNISSKNQTNNSGAREHESQGFSKKSSR